MAYSNHSSTAVITAKRRNNAPMMSCFLVDCLLSYLLHVFFTLLSIFYTGEPLYNLYTHAIILLSVTIQYVVLTSFSKVRVTVGSWYSIQPIHEWYT